MGGSETVQRESEGEGRRVENIVGKGMGGGGSDEEKRELLRYS